MITDQERDGAVQNLLSHARHKMRGRTWYLYWCTFELAAGPVAVGFGLYLDWTWLIVVGVIMLLGPAMLLGWIMGQFNGALGVAETAVDQLITYASVTDDSASSTMLMDLKTGRMPLRRIK